MSEPQHCQRCDGGPNKDYPCPGVICHACANKSAEQAKAFIADIETALEGKTPPGFDLNNATAVGAVLRLQAACAVADAMQRFLEELIRDKGTSNRVRERARSLYAEYRAVREGT